MMQSLPDRLAFYSATVPLMVSFVCGHEGTENLPNNSGVIKALSSKHSCWRATHTGAQ